MTDVRAGSHQRAIATGELGIVTLWVRAKSEFAALARAKVILTNKRYASIGRLSSYAEALAHDPLACTSEAERVSERREDLVLAGYEAMKEQALGQADGLHEVWLGASDRQYLLEQKIA
jgi:hypothetical protein